MGDFYGIVVDERRPRKISSDAIFLEDALQKISSRLLGLKAGDLIKD